MHADTAMYKAKEQGGGSYQAYSRAMNASALQRLTLEHSLRRALEREEFEVHYQPIVEARSGRPVAAEALVRWRHPDLGLLLPLEFVPLAEENGLIVPIGEWVIQRACLQNRAWQDAGTPPGPGGGEPLRPAASPRDNGNGRADPAGHRTRGAVPGSRAHRKRAGEPSEGERGRAARSAGDGAASLGGRLRHRVFVLQLPEALPARHPQDRPHLRPGDHHRSGRRGDHHGDHRHGACAGTAGGGGRGRDRGAPRGAPAAGV